MKKSEILIWILAAFTLGDVFCPQLEARRIKDMDYRLISGEEMIKRGSENAVLDMFYVEHAGKLYVVKNALSNDFIYGEEEFLEKELFIYALAKRIFGKDCNLADVKLLHYRDVQGTGLGDWMNKHNFDKVLLSRLAEEYKNVDEVKTNFWREQLIAFWVFIRDFDHGLEGPDSNLYLFSDKEQVFGISYDHNKAFWGNITDTGQISIGEDLALTAFLKFSDISYLKLAQIANQIISIKDEDIRHLALESGIEDKNDLDYITAYLSTSGRRLLKDLEYLIAMTRGEKVDLYVLIREKGNE